MKAELGTKREPSRSRSREPIRRKSPEARQRSEVRDKEPKAAAASLGLLLDPEVQKISYGGLHASALEDAKLLTRLLGAEALMK